eukprot:c25329_g1_i1.p1 GENE.c25329_g1_i1~~c25329_g1_i1.p1  ORF type:complete len:130 (+),score=27.74 c25329_g1_i1:35-391(+)
MKFVVFVCLAVFASASVLEEINEETAFVQEEMKVQPANPAQPAAPFVPAQLFGLNQSPTFSLFFNPFSFVGLYNPQMEMLPHTLTVLKALHPKQFEEQDSKAAKFGPQAGYMGAMYGL